MSPRLNFGTKYFRSHATKRSPFADLNIVDIVTQPLRRMAPIIVRFFPQIIGRGSS